MPTPTDPLILAAANYVRQRFSSQIQSAQKIGSRQVPRLFQIDSLPSDGVLINTVAGPVAFQDDVNDPDDPPERTFFVDIAPDANWDHECTYIVVHHSGRLTHVDDVSPPSSRTNAILEEIDYLSL